MIGTGGGEIVAGNIAAEGCLAGTTIFGTTTLDFLIGGTIGGLELTTFFVARGSVVLATRERAAVGAVTAGAKRVAPLLVTDDTALLLEKTFSATLGSADIAGTICGLGPSCIPAA